MTNVKKMWAIAICFMSLSMSSIALAGATTVTLKNNTGIPDSDCLIYITYIHDVNSTPKTEQQVPINFDQQLTIGTIDPDPYLNFIELFAHYNNNIHGWIYRNIQNSTNYVITFNSMDEKPLISSSPAPAPMPVPGPNPGGPGAPGGMGM